MPRRRFIPLVLFVSLASPLVQATSVTFTETLLGGGLWQYDYTVTNPLDPVSQAGVDLFDVVFAFPSAPNLISVPGGWDFIPAGGSIETFSTNVGEPPFGTDIPPGGSLAGFSFQFGQQTPPIVFTITFSDFTVQGGTAVNSAVPEPASAVMVGTSIALILLASLFWRFLRARSLVRVLSSPHRI